VDESEKADCQHDDEEPEMYQLYNGPRLVPAPKNLSSRVLNEAATNVEGEILVDTDKTPIRIFEGASYASLQEINRLQSEGHDIGRDVLLQQ
jgi:hypothetical protein